MSEQYQQIMAATKLASEATDQALLDMLGEAIDAYVLGNSGNNGFNLSDLDIPLRLGVIQAELAERLEATDE